MKLSIIFSSKSFCLFIVILALVSCKKDNNPVEPQNGLTEQQKQEIETAHSSISVLASTALVSQNPISSFNQILNQIKQTAGVESAWISGSALFVKYKNGGTVSWYCPQSEIIPPYMLRSSLPLEKFGFRKISELVGNTNACLINAQYKDEGRPNCKDIINQLKNNLKNNNYNVTVENGTDANIEFFKQMNNYGIIFYISHGSYDGTHVWLQTGEETDSGVIGSIEILFDLAFVSDWRDGLISAQTVANETRNGEKKNISYLCFSEKFIEKYINNLPHSLIYLVGCQALKANNTAISFNNKGAAVVIGWDETQSKAQSTGELLIETMLGGKNLNDAIVSLPTDSKQDDIIENGQTIHADLVYYPPSGKTIELVNTVSPLTINLTSPYDGLSSTNRIITVSGYISDTNVKGNAILSVNDVSTALSLSSNNSFSQNVTIKKGINTIKINFYSSKGFASKNITLTGNFPTLDLWTELRWNTDYTDVDIHLLPPDKSVSSLWTNDDCYYKNKQTSWGASLDVDDIDGRGPEHIVMQTASLVGKYRLFIHYYATNGFYGKTQAFVSVSSKDASNQNFGPYDLTISGTDNSLSGSGANRGDLWEVCTIEFPSGTITPVNKYYYLGLGKINSTNQKEQK